MTAQALPKGCTNLKLRQLSRLATRHYEGFLGESGLKITQYSLLTHVVRLGPLRSGELAQAMRLSASALSRNLQPLLKQGLLEVSAGDDARSRIVSATVAGIAMREQTGRAWKRAQLALNERLGVERVAALHELLDQSIALLGDDQGDDDEH
jgi:DNA-binding MarR family transcriptional regulator